MEGLRDAARNVEHKGLKSFIDRLNSDNINFLFDYYGEQTPLMFAIERYNSRQTTVDSFNEMIERILKIKGIEVDKKNDRGMTALMVAVQKNLLKITEMLLEKGRPNYLLRSVRAAGEASERLLPGTPESGSAPNCFINVTKADATDALAVKRYDLQETISLFGDKVFLGNVINKADNIPTVFSIDDSNGVAQAEGGLGPHAGPRYEHKRLTLPVGIGKH
jgi:ankyrin repeat protein